MTWKERLLGVPLAVLGAVMLLASAAGVAATHTDWGRAKLRSFLLGKLNASIQGHIEVDAFVEGDLLRSITLAGVEIYEPDGSVFAQVDTIGLRYSWIDFLIGNIEVPEVRLVRPIIELRKPGDGDWNFERVFAARARSDPQAAVEGTRDDARTIVLREVRIRSGDVTLKLPWTPGPNETSESSRWRLESADDGWWRVVRLEDLNAALPIARVAGPASLGRLFQISRLTGSVAVLRDPIEVKQLRAGIEQHGDTVSFDLWEGVFPESQLFGGGWVTLSSPLDYDFTVTGTPLNTRDLRWLLPEIPLGLATLDYRMRSLPNGTAFTAYNANWESDQARLSGRFSMRTIAGPDKVAFDSVNLSVNRLSTDLIPQLTGWEPPVEGILSGRVALDGPLTRLLLDSDVRFHPADGGAHSHLRAEGAAFVAGIDPGGQDLVVFMDSLSTDLIRAFVPDLRLQGVISGDLGMDGSLAAGLNVLADVEQRDPDLGSLRVRGGGNVLRVGVQPYQVDLRFQVEPLSFNTLSDYYGGIPLRGDYRGWFHLEGALRDLDVEARLAGPGDSLVFDGNVSHVEDDWAYRGVLRGKRAQIAFLGEGAAGSNLDFRIELEGQGVRLEQLRGRARAELYSSLIDGVRFDSAFAELRVADARLRLDTAVILSELGRIEAAGALGLRSDVVDSLAVRVEADSLSGLNRWLSPALDPLGPATLATNGEPAAAVTPLRLSGFATATGFLVGNFHQLTALGTVEGGELAYGDWTADSLYVEDLDLVLLGEGLRASGSVRAAHAGLYDLQFESVSLTGEVIDRVVEADFKLANASGSSVAGRVLAELGPELYAFELESFVAMLGSSSWTLERTTRLQVARSGSISLGVLRLSSEQGLIEATGNVPEAGHATFRLHVEGLDLAELAALHPQDRSMSGRLTLDAELSGRTRAPVLAGDLHIVDGALMDVPFSEILGSLDYEDGRLGGNLSMSQREVPLFTLRGDIPFVVALPDLAFGITQGPLNLRLQGDSIPLNLLELATQDVEFSSGFARAAVDIGGTPDDVDLSGELTFVNGGGYVVPTGIGYRGMNGEAQFSGKTVQVRELRLAGGGGSGVITGSLELSEWRNPVFDLRLNAHQLPAYDQFDARMVVSGQAELHGPYDSARLTGRLSVVSGVLYIEEIGRRREIVKPFGEGGLFLLDSVFAVEQGLTPTSGNVFLDNLTIDQDIVVRRDTWLRSEEANIEIAGELSLRHGPAEEEFRIDGTLRALRGDYRLFNKRFALEEGEIEFVGTPALNPNIRLVANHRVQTQKRPLEITVLIRGTLEEPKIKLESDAQPPIPESDLLSYLLFGRPTYEITRAGGEQGSLIEDVTAGVPEAFVGYALESLLVGETGIAYVDVSRAPVKGTQGFYSSSTAPVLAATQVEVGWYLAPTVFVSVAQHLSTAINIPTVRLEWKLNNNLTLQGVAEPRLARGTTVLTQNTGADLTETVGLFLFYGWTY